MLTSVSDVQTLCVYDGLGDSGAMLADYAPTAYAYQFDPFRAAVLSGSGRGAGEVPSPFKRGIQDRATGWVHDGNWHAGATLA